MNNRRNADINETSRLVADMEKAIAQLHIATCPAKLTDTASQHNVSLSFLRNKLVELAALTK